MSISYMWRISSNDACFGCFGCAAVNGDNACSFTWTKMIQSYFLVPQLSTAADPAVPGPAGGRGEAPSPEVLLHRSGFVPQRASSVWTQERLGATLTWGKTHLYRSNTSSSNTKLIADFDHLWSASCIIILPTFKLRRVTAVLWSSGKNNRHAHFYVF